MALDTPVAVSNLTIQGNDYPIYGTQARAREYFVPHISGSVFNNAAFDLQQQSLVTSRRMIDRQTFTADPATTTQITKFPQSGETTVPLAIETAEYELALLLIRTPNFFNTATTGSNRKRIRAGSVELENFSATTGANRIGGGAPTFPPQIQDLLRPYLGSDVSIITPVVGGTNNKSFIIPRIGNDISEGL